MIWKNYCEDQARLLSTGNRWHSCSSIHSPVWREAGISSGHTICIVTISSYFCLAALPLTRVSAYSTGYILIMTLCMLLSYSVNAEQFNGRRAVGCRDKQHCMEATSGSQASIQALSSSWVVVLKIAASIHECHRGDNRHWDSHSLLSVMITVRHDNVCVVSSEEEIR